MNNGIHFWKFEGIEIDYLLVFIISDKYECKNEHQWIYWKLLWREAEQKSEYWETVRRDIPVTASWNIHRIPPQEHQAKVRKLDQQKKKSSKEIQTDNFDIGQTKQLYT